ncbi:MAG: hypothetical protein ACT6XY_03790 [Phreatobacter sp.]|uniref:hypothetical protein n=1 Tax=Phreatobacter sp. TaxID=1966341 RepID=UPI004034F73D
MKALALSLGILAGAVIPGASQTIREQVGPFDLERAANYAVARDLLHNVCGWDGYDRELIAVVQHIERIAMTVHQDAFYQNQIVKVGVGMRAAYQAMTPDGRLFHCGLLALYLKEHTDRFQSQHRDLVRQFRGKGLR